MESIKIKHKFLATSYKKAKDIEEQINQLFTPLSEKQLNWKPSEKSWGVAECLQHLILTGKIYRKKYKAAIEKNNLLKMEETEIYRPTSVGKMYFGLVDPKAKRKIPAPKAFKAKPTTKFSKEIITDYLKSVEQLQDEIEQADSQKQHINKIKISVPIVHVISFSLGDYFEIHLRHNQRHINQAKAVIAEEGFPKSN